MRVVVAATATQLEACLELRAEVFVAEQGIDPALERDGRDTLATTRHLLALDETGAAIGAARLLVDAPGRVHVGRVAVRAAARGRDVGRALMGALEELALALAPGHDGAVLVELSAQETVAGFYARLGYRLGAERHLEAGIAHIDAWKTIAPPSNR